MEEFVMEKSKVYIKVDEDNSILRCEGGYTMSNIDNYDEWIFIDEGHGDRFNLCQTHYFEGGLYTEDGIPRYKYADDTIVLRTEEEIAEDGANIPVPSPSTDDTDVWEELDKAYQEGVNSI